VSNPPLACGKVWTFEGCDSVNDVHSISRTHSPQPKRPRVCRRLATDASEASVYLLARLPGDREPPLLRVLVLHADYTRTHTHKDTHANARTHALLTTSVGTLSTTAPHLACTRVVSRRSATGLSIGIWCHVEEMLCPDPHRVSRRDALCRHVQCYGSTHSDTHN
jgi:hypothetical protein